MQSEFFFLVKGRIKIRECGNKFCEGDTTCFMNKSELTDKERKEVEGKMCDLLSEFEKSIAEIEIDFREACRDVVEETNDKERI